MGDTVHVRVCCDQWKVLRSTIRFPMESSGEEEDGELGCVVDFKGLTVGQWQFLQPELMRADIPYDYINYSLDEPHWVRKLQSCR
jgi:hypothetical protein